MRKLLKKCKFFKYLFLIIFSIKLSCASAQLNLVKDPSFEDTIICPEFFNPSLGNDALKYWRHLDSNSYSSCNYGYLNNCSSGVEKLPENQWFNQSPRKSNGLVLLAFVYALNPNYRRSIIRGKLKQKLKLGQTYCAKMYVNPCERFDRYSQDGIAMYFDNGQLDTIISKHNDSSGIYPFVHPQVSNPQGNIILDTINWTLVSGTFVANGTEEFITIGNFKTDANTDTAVILPSSNSPSCELLIDDVSLYPVDAHNWLHDTSGTLGDSTVIGLPNYEVPDGRWFSINMLPLGTGSQIKVKNTQAITQYIQSVDVCNSVLYDTMVVYAYPLAINNQKLIANNLKVYPNPASTQLIITTDYVIMGKPLQMLDITGKVVYEEVLNKTNTTIDVQHFAKGIYFVKWFNKSVKVVIE